jgi:RNA polymerase sigma-70 factor (ECF subfamily)
MSDERNGAINGATRRTLLARVRDPADRAAWIEFHGLYAPLLLRYARSLGLSRDDAEEVRDASLALLVERMKSFDYQPERGRFKTWLYRIAHGKAVDLLRRQVPERADTAALAELVDPAAAAADERFEAAWRTQQRRRALARALREARSTSRRDARAFRALLNGKQTVADVCAALEMNANQVYKAKSRVLARVREIIGREDEEREQ